MPRRLLTGLSSPTATACDASVSSDDAIGSLVNVICLKAAARMSGLRPLPSTEVSSALAAASAAAVFLLMKSFASIWPLSSPLTAPGCAARKDCVTTRLVVTNCPFGHSLGVAERGGGQRLALELGRARDALLHDQRGPAGRGPGDDLDELAVRAL